MCHFPRHFKTLTALGAAALLVSSVATADEVESAFERSFELERAGRPSDAAEALEAALPTGGDYGAELRLGWLWFQSGEYARARQHYTEAATISKGGSEPRLGLAWCALRQGRIDDARAGFSALLAESPELESAREGLALTESVPSVVASVGVSATAHAYAGNPFKSWGIGTAVDLGLDWRSGLVLDATYRFTELGTRDTPLAAGTVFDHHAVFVDAGYQMPTFGFTLHYGLLVDRSTTGGLTHIVGGRIALRLLGELSLEGSAALPDGVDPVVRIAPAWRVDLGRGFSITPAAAVQLTSEGPRWNVGLSAAWSSARGGAWVSGKYGDEVRPAYLDAALAYDSAETLRYGASAGGWLAVDPSWSLTFAYEWVRYDYVLDDGDTNNVESDAHFFKIGALWSSEPAR